MENTLHIPQRPFPPTPTCLRATHRQMLRRAGRATKHTRQDNCHIAGISSAYTYYSMQSRNRGDHISSLIRMFKRDPAANPVLAWEFADALVHVFSATFGLRPSDSEPRIVVPVPSDTNRYERNGTDPVSAILSAGFNAFERGTGARIVRALLKIRSYPDLRNITGYKKRSAIVSGAFAVNKSLVSEVEGQTVILFDDVLTTGATANECAKVLATAGVREIHVLALAASSSFRLSRFSAKHNGGGGKL